MACGDDSGTTLSLNGEACESGETCESGDCRQDITGCHWFFGCTTIELTDGMCTSSCTWIEEGTDEEMLQADCLDGEQCLAVNADAESTLCFQGCEFDEDCREDYVCAPISDFGTCLPPPGAARIVDTSELTASPNISILK